MTVFWRCQFTKMALPLQCNRIAVTVQSRCRYGVIAMPLQCNGDAITPQSQQFLAKNRSVALSKGERLPFFRSICPCFQVLNFSNNILQFDVIILCLSCVAKSPYHAPLPEPSEEMGIPVSRSAAQAISPYLGSFLAIFDEYLAHGLLPPHPRWYLRYVHRMLYLMASILFG